MTPTLLLHRTKVVLLGRSAWQATLIASSSCPNSQFESCIRGGHKKYPGAVLVTSQVETPRDTDTPK